MSAERHGRIEEICVRALQLDEPSRAAFVADMCAGDEALRREVESLLAHEHAAEHLFRAPAFDIAAVPLTPHSSTLTGRQVGPYTLLEPLGAGGMGEVYRARDASLKRDVAIKMLPALWGSHSDRQARFAREARLLAALNDPHIASIYALEQFEGMPALVLELVEGDTLADLIARGPVPVTEVLAIARQIIDALETAHAKGIIHRDLKPANVKVTPEGTVKVLDFGLAKALWDDASEAKDVTAPTTLTGQPMILGTAAYMSPEQAQGRATDRRTDIWAFACVLYEMLTGKRAFHGETAADTIASVIAREPDWRTLPENTPPAVHRLLRRCLQKDRMHRLADIADARLEINDVLLGVPSTEQATAPRNQRWSRGAVLRVGASLLAAVAAGAGIVYVALQQTLPQVQAIRFQMALPQPLPIDPPGLAISPDGSTLAFVAKGLTGEDLVWIRRFDRADATPLPGTEEAYSPFWAPDNESIAFFAQGKLKRVGIAGGAPQVLCDVASPQAGATAGAWNADGVIIFAKRFGPLHRVSAQGGEATPITTIDEARQEFGHYDPSFLPDGDHFVFEVGALPKRGGLRVGSLTSKDTHPLLARSVNPFLVTNTGYLLFVDAGVLKAQKLDVKRAELVGSSVPLAEGVFEVSASATGTITYRGFGSAPRQLTWFDRAGHALRTVGRPAMYDAPALSPDESRVAVARDGDVWVLDVTRGTETRLTLDAAGAGNPIWSPDGTQIVFTRNGQLVRKNASGAGPEETIGGEVVAPMDWSADGRFITYFAFNPDTQTDLFLMPMVGPRTPILFLQTPFPEVENRLSPDGHWMAYASEESGRLEVYVQTFPPSEQKVLISTSGGMQPMWRRDQRELFYLALDGTLMVTSLKAGTLFEAGVPQPLFRTRTKLLSARSSYASTRNGDRFLVNAYVDTAATNVSVILNWPALLSD
jgi:eukaryotic-like serine/threonine-protein kinase